MSLLDEVLAAHGGLSTFQQYKEVRVHLRISGRLISTRGVSGRSRELVVCARTKAQHLTIEPFPGEGFRGVYTPQKTWLESSGQIETVREQPRARFARGLLHYPWDDLDLLYFFGYALWNYLMAPFLFAWDGVEVKENPSVHRERGQTWRSLDVTFPESMPSHCKTQRFYFDEAGLLRRLDYIAEIFGPAIGAHYCDEHKNFGGIQVPTRREVFPRLGRQSIKLFNVMEGQLKDVVWS